MKQIILLGALVFLVIMLSTFLVAAVVTNQNHLSSKDSSNIKSPLKLISDDDSEDFEETLSATDLKRTGSQISEEEAISIANSAVEISSVGRMTDVELERENGLLVYAVEFTKNGIETDVKIDAFTGKVVKIESDLDDDEED